MIQFNKFDPQQYQRAGAGATFGSLTSHQKQNVNTPKRPEGIDGNVSFGKTNGVQSANYNEGLVARLDKLDSQTIVPNNKTSEQGQNLYLMA